MFRASHSYDLGVTGGAPLQLCLTRPRDYGLVFIYVSECEDCKTKTAVIIQGRLEDMHMHKNVVQLILLVHRRTCERHCSNTKSK